MFSCSTMYSLGNEVLSATANYIFSKSYPLCRNICEKLKTKIFNSPCIATSTRDTQVQMLTEQNLDDNPILSYNEALTITPNTSNPPLYGHVFVQDGDVEISLLGESCNEHNVSLLQDPPPAYTTEISHSCESRNTHYYPLTRYIIDKIGFSSTHSREI